MTKYIQCKDCTRIFGFFEDQQKWFRARNWPDPIRCKRCIKRAKQRRADPYWGWASTMGGGLPAKKGHRRVNYPVHVVGGFR